MGGCGSLSHLVVPADDALRVLQESFPVCGESLPLSTSSSCSACVLEDCVK
jgi:hypothetical protein